jgi:hypothetical protein
LIMTVAMVFVVRLFLGVALAAYLSLALGPVCDDVFEEGSCS